ncbi:copper amine oxidase [Paenibacillus lutimineralis]|uniref:Copper amine oxidase n=1 Tax=Paenibacillus lutimineralis TaxID=2707005 RepID=A0A3S9UW81_9BACL|nr:copper amine oxidase [Paenibacillus lutimineralis]AZS14584.1 copper amine oxidase [Paenibacillus lutimineralis]
MKWRRVAILVTIFSLMGGSLLFADSASQKVRLLMNGRELDDGSYIIDGKTYIPVRELEGLIYYDDSTKTVYYYKPNVHISLIQSSDGKVFGDINKSGKLKFNVFTQVDNLKTDISAVRVSITSPDGNTTVIQTSDIPNNKDNFWFRTEDFNYDFKNAGKYKIGFYMKPAGGGDFTLVSEKNVNVLK